MSELPAASGLAYPPGRVVARKTHDVYFARQQEDLRVDGWCACFVSSSASSSRPSSALAFDQPAARGRLPSAVSLAILEPEQARQPPGASRAHCR